MIYDICYFFERAFSKIRQLYHFFYHKYKLRQNQVEYCTFPLFHGKTRLLIKGRLQLGSNVTFTSTTRVNYVGLSKECSIYVGEKGLLSIGDNTGFSGVSIYCLNKITIGCHVNIGGNVSIWDTDFHPLNYIKRRENSISEIGHSPVSIGDDVFVGANTIILKGVTIGSKSIIGAGSVVTKDIPPGEVWAGNPAKYIRKC